MLRLLLAMTGVASPSLTLGAIDCLAHMHDGAAHERLLAVDRIAESFVEAEIGGEQLVRIEPDLVEAALGGDALGMAHETPADPAALEAGKHGDVLDEEMIRKRNHLDQADETIADEGVVDDMLSHGARVIRRHRLGLAPDDGTPFRVGRPREIADRGGGPGRRP